MRYRLLIWSLLMTLSSALWATHNRAGEITYTWVSGYTYEVTVTTYTNTGSQIDRCELTVEWGDNTTSVLYRVNGSSGTCPPPALSGVVIPGEPIRENIYRGTHTFPSPGYYTIAVQDLNRNDGVVNINNSVQIPFYVSSTILVNPAIGPNNSPQLLNPPIDNGCVGQLFIHNAGAFDPDGDSLSYELVDCRGLNGRPLTETYSPTYVQDSVRIDEYTGDFVWDVPQVSGEFNFAFEIREYRRNLNGNYQLIGLVTRDMQVNIEACVNRPPVIDPLGPFCVEAGSTLNFQVTATDPDGDDLILSATGGPFEVTPSATFPNPATGPQPLTAQFSWTPSCDQVRFQPFFVTFRAEDEPSIPIPLVEIQTVEIRVVAPAPQNPLAVGNGSVIDLSWDPNACAQANGYDVYRRKGSYGFTPAQCETGVPEYTGYEYWGSTVGWSSTSFTDSVDVEQGVQYCYMVVATFDDRSESYASVEFCAELPKTLPIVTHVDVGVTDPVNGEIEVRWIPARDLDSVAFPPPYSYVLERSPELDGVNYTTVVTLPDTDTNYIDIGLNTVDLGWNYRVRLLNGPQATEVGISGDASSIFAIATPRDEAIELHFDYLTPWVNDTIIVYAETIPGSGVFDSIGLTTNGVFRDTGLVNGNEYCYYGLGVGRFTGTNMPAPLLNRSQVVCAEPDDNEAPCAPEVTWSADCEAGQLQLNWVVPPGCPSDIASYNIYYRASPDEPWPSSPLISGLTGTSFTFDEGSIVGCYAVTAVDDAINPNESPIIEAFCLEGCAQIELPNVFSPDGDGLNDFFVPVRDANGDPIFRDIDDFSISVYNRWGRLVYRTESTSEFVSTGWDGRDRTTGRDCSEGVYFYICTFTARSLGDAPQQVLQGNLHLFR